MSTPRLALAWLASVALLFLPITFAGELPSRVALCALPFLALCGMPVRVLENANSRNRAAEAAVSEKGGAGAPGGAAPAARPGASGGASRLPASTALAAFLPVLGVALALDLVAGLALRPALLSAGSAAGCILLLALATDAAVGRGRAALHAVLWTLLVPVPVALVTALRLGGPPRVEALEFLARRTPLGAFAGRSIELDPARAWAALGLRDAPVEASGVSAALAALSLSALIFLGSTLGARRAR